VRLAAPIACALLVVGAGAPAAPAQAGPDRSSPPEVRAPEPLPLPELETWVAASGVIVRVIRIADVRKVVVGVTLHRGSLDLDGAPSHVADFTGLFQDVAAGDHGADELEALEDMEDISVSSGGVMPRLQELELECPREKIEQGAALLADVLHRPRYPRRDLELAKERLINGYLEEAPASPAAVASSLMAYGWYDRDSVYGWRPDLPALARVARRRLIDLHARMLDASPVSVLVVGDVTREAVERWLAPVLAGLGRPGDERSLPAFEPAAGTRVLAGRMAGQDQAVLQVRFAAPDRASPERHAISAIDWALGGHFLSRLNVNLREEKGLTYAASSWLTLGETHGTWTAATEVEVANVTVAVHEIQGELARIVAEGVRREELAACWRERVADWNRVLQTASSAYRFYAGLLAERRTLADARADLDALRALAPEDTRRVAHKWLGAESPQLWVVVGDRERLEPQLESLGWTARWSEPADAVVGKLEPPTATAAE
jgi:zinc protease